MLLVSLYNLFEGWISHVKLMFRRQVASSITHYIPVTYYIHNANHVRTIYRDNAHERQHFQLIQDVCICCCHKDSIRSYMYTVQMVLLRITAWCLSPSLPITGRRDHITPVLHGLHWLPVRRTVAFKVLLLTFKALHGVTS